MSSNLTRRLGGGIPRFAELLSERFPGGATIGAHLDRVIRRMDKVQRGLPRKHQATHLQDGDDAFPAPAAVATLDPNLGESLGTATNYPLADHRHALDLKLTTKGDLLTRDGSQYVRLPAPADGSVWVADAAQTAGWRARFLRQLAAAAADFTKTGDTTLATVTGLSLSVLAGRTYSFRALLFVDADAVGGSKFAIAGTATATAIIYHIRLLDDATDAFLIAARQTALGGSSGQSGSTAALALIEGTIVVNAAGTLLVQFAQNAAAGASSVKAGSTWTVEDVSA